jgi:hypothetical protein
LDRQAASLEWDEADLGGVRVERSPPLRRWLAGFDAAASAGYESEFLEALMPSGREEIPWSAMAVALVLGRLLDPSRELHLAEHGYEASALAELLGVPAAKVNDDRLYRSLDRLLPHNPALEKHLEQRLGSHSTWTTTYCLMTGPALALKAQQQPTRNPGAVNRSITVRTASRSTLHWQ